MSRHEELLFRLRTVALVAAVAGAVGSVGLMLRAAQHPPGFLLILFAIWDAAPFVVLAWLIVVSKRWSARAGTTLYGATFIVTLVALTLYANTVLHPPKSTGAFMFVAVPIGSWVLIAIVVAIAALISRRLHQAERPGQR